jgi:hypothetical protein
MRFVPLNEVEQQQSKGLTFVPLDKVEQQSKGLTFVPLAEANTKQSTATTFEPPVPEPKVDTKPVEKAIKTQAEDNSFESGKGFLSSISGMKTSWEGVKQFFNAGQIEGSAKAIQLYDKIDSGEIKNPDDIRKASVAIGGKDSEWASSILPGYGSVYANASPERRQEIRDKARSEIETSKKSFNDSMKLVEQYQEENKKNKGKVENFTDAKSVQDYADWLAFNVGSGAAQLAPIMVAAYLTKTPGVLTVGTGMELGSSTQTRINHIMKEASKETDPQKRTDAIIKYVSDSGDVTLTSALVSGSLDTILGPDAKLIKGSLSEALKTQTKKEIAKQIPKELAKATAGEGLTGGLQEIVQINAERQLGEQTGDIITKDNIKRVVNSATAEAAGGLTGGAAIQSGQLAKAAYADTDYAKNREIGQALQQDIDSRNFTRSGIERTANQELNTGLTPEYVAARQAGIPDPRTAQPQEESTIQPQETANVAAPVETQQTETQGTQQVAAAEPAAEIAEPPVAEGMTRLYHGSATPGRTTGPAWFSSNRDYAQNYREGAELQYVDVPTEQVNASLDPDNLGQTVDAGFTFNTELDSDVTGERKILASPVAQPIEQAALPEDQVTPAKNLFNPFDKDEDLFNPFDQKTSAQPAQEFFNPLEAESYAELTDMLGLPEDATEAEVKDMAEYMGHDAVVYNTPEGKKSFAIEEQLDDTGDNQFKFLNVVPDATGTNIPFVESVKQQETKRTPSLRRTIDRLNKALESGQMTPEQHSAAVKEERELDKARQSRKPVNPRTRGADYIRERLLAAKRKGDITEDESDLAEWFIMQNPALVSDLGISIRAPKKGNQGVAGFYNDLARIITVLKKSGSNSTVIHEILHHMERMMPTEVQDAIRGAWVKKLNTAKNKAQKGKDENLKKFFDLLTDYHFGSASGKNMQEALKMITEGKVDYSNYQFVNPSEFWAVNATSIMQNRYNFSDTTLNRLKNWLREFAQTIKGVFGLPSDAPIIKALNSLMKSDGKFKSEIMLGEGSDFLGISTETNKFKNWFGKSKVVDKNGNPLVMYHGTKEDIEDGVFRMERGMIGKGAYFTADPNEANEFATNATWNIKPNIVPAYISIKNPYYVTDKFEKVPSDLKEQGYDGVILQNADGSVKWAVPITPSQIKSTFNKGDFSSTDNRIHYNISPNASQEAKDALDELNANGLGASPKDPKFSLKDSFANAVSNPKLTAQSAKAATKRFLDTIETNVFSTDAAFNNKVRRAVMESTLSEEEKIGALLEISLSQTVHSDAVASNLLQYGEIKYNDELHKWEAIQNDNNYVNLSKQISDLAKKHNITPEEAQLIGHRAFEARRTKGLANFAAEMKAEARSLFNQANKARKAAADANAAGDVQEATRLTAVSRKFLKEAQSYYNKAPTIHLTPDQVKLGMELFNKFPELNDISDTWMGMRENTKNALVESGLWTEEEADKLLANMDYVPFFREEQIAEKKGPKEFLRGLNVQAKEKRLKGSKKAVNNVFDNMARWMQYAAIRSVRNRSALALVDAAVENGMATKIDPKSKATPTEPKNVVDVWRNGEKESYEMDDPLYMKAFIGMESVAIPALKEAAALSNMLRDTVVLNPIFTISQVPQDAFTAMFTSGIKTRYALTIPARAAKEFVLTLVKMSKTHEQLRKFSAVGVKDFNSSVARLDAEITSGIKAPPGMWGKTKSVLNHIAMSGDNAIRQAVYEAAISSGKTQGEAIEKAFQVINFRYKGDSKLLAIMSQVIPFFNAYLAVQNVAYKTITGRGTSPTERAEALKTLLATTGAVYVLSTIYAMMNGDDEDYKKKPAVIRDRLFMIPGTGGLSIPIRKDLFAIPKILAEHTYLLLADKGYEDARKFKDSMKSAIASAILSPTAVPQAVKAPVEISLNHDFYQDRPIIPARMASMESERKFNNRTSEFAKILGKTGFMAPMNVDHFVKGYFGSLGGVFLTLTNQILQSNPDVPRPAPSFREVLNSIPGTSGYISKPHESGLKSDFYVLLEECNKAANTMKDIEKRTPSEIKEAVKDKTAVLRAELAPELNQMAEELTDIRNSIDFITNAPEKQFTAAEKQQRINKLKEVEQKMLEKMNIKKLRKVAKL